MPLRHTIASSVLATQHSHKWLDGVLDAYAASPLAQGTPGMLRAAHAYQGLTTSAFSLPWWSAIEAASSVLVLWSGRSVNSSWVRTEAGEGQERGILLPVLIEDVRPPLAFRRIQAANLIEWDGTASHLAFQKLVGDIAGLLGPPPAVVAQERLSERLRNGLKRGEEAKRKAKIEQRRSAEQEAQGKVAKDQIRANRNPTSLAFPQPVSPRQAK